MLVGSTTSAYEYDANGNQIRRDGQVSSYNLANQLASTTRGDTTTSYTYDGDGGRLTRNTNGALAERYWWNPAAPLPQLALETNADDSLLRRYVNGIRPISLATTATASVYH